MKEVIEESERPLMTLNPDLSKYDDVVLFPKKLEEAIETLSKHPIPAHIYLARYSKEEQEQGFSVQGRLKRADANSFVVVSTNNRSQMLYTIHAEPKILSKVVKNYLGDFVNVHIKPLINADNVFEYRLIDIDLKNYDDEVLFRDKLAEAEETIAKYGIPEKWAHEFAEKGEHHHFWTSGVFIRADGEENTFTLAAKTKADVSETTYTICTTAELLSQLIKEYWGQEVKVHIQHTVKKEGQWLYELLEVRDV